MREIRSYVASVKGKALEYIFPACIKLHKYYTKASPNEFDKMWCSEKVRHKTKNVIQIYL